jgi:hypothetical protein
MVRSRVSKIGSTFGIMFHGSEADFLDVRWDRTDFGGDPSACSSWAGPVADCYRDRDPGLAISTAPAKTCPAERKNRSKF